MAVHALVRDEEQPQGLAERTGNLARTLYQAGGEAADSSTVQRAQHKEPAPSNDSIAVRVSINIGKSELELMSTANEVPMFKTCCIYMPCLLGV